PRDERPRRDDRRSGVRAIERGSLMSYPESPREGTDGFAAQIQAIWRAINESRGANAAESIVVTGGKGFVSESPASARRVRIANGTVTFWDEATDPAALPGFLTAQAANRSLHLYPPRDDGSQFANTISVNGRRGGAAGRATIHS